jgi:hypothetical protein
MPDPSHQAKHSGWDIGQPSVTEAGRPPTDDGSHSRVRHELPDHRGLVRSAPSPMPSSAVDGPGEVPSDAAAPGDAPRLADLPAEMPHPGDHGSEGLGSYDQQEVVNTYIERLSPMLAEIADDCAALGAEDLRRQAELMRSMLPLLPGQPELVFPFFVEFKDLQRQVLEHSAQEEKELEGGSGGGNIAASASSDDGIMTLGPGGRKRLWDRLAETLMSRVDPDIWKLLAHLRAVREWSVSGEVSANVGFAKGKMGLDITFGS